MGYGRSSTLLIRVHFEMIRKQIGDQVVEGEACQGRIRFWGEGCAVRGRANGSRWCMASKVFSPSISPFHYNIPLQSLRYR
jgi:hypothetical protein